MGFAFVFRNSLKNKMAKLLKQVSTAKNFGRVVLSRQFHHNRILHSGPLQFKHLNKDDSETIAQKLRPLVGTQNVSLAEIVRSQHGWYSIIQPWPLAIKWLLNKPYVNEAYLTGQNLA